MAEQSIIEVHELPPTPPPKSPAPTPPKPTLAAKPVLLPKPVPMVDKSLSSAANLAKLLPSGTILAFQALSPSFTNRGQCYTSNKVLTWTLLLISTLSCLFFSLTDTVTSADGKVYCGVATRTGFYVLNFDGEEEEEAAERKKVFGDELKERMKLRPLDYVHAIFSVVMFLALTFGDAEVQRCLFPGAGPNAKELLVNLPLGAAVVSGLVFMVFPTSRKGIGYSDSAPQSSQ